MLKEALVHQIFSKRSCLCIGLDSDIDKIPRHLLQEDRPVVTFNRAIINATQDLCVAYKVNSAFYESRGSDGWADLEATMALIPEDCLAILDAKRGDIGNTTDHYAKMAFESLGADAVTIAPYMGKDSISSFIKYPDKWSILLALTSNPSSGDFELIEDKGGKYVYQSVIEKASKWASADQLMFVVGATHPHQLLSVRQMAKDYFFLVPGVGAQGGSVKEVIESCWIPDQGGLLINSSRGIIYAGGDEDFAQSARLKAQDLVTEMQFAFA